VHPHFWLLLPQEILTVVLSQLDTQDLARLAATCRTLWRDAPGPPPRPMPPLRPMGPVETELRRRATAHGLHIGSSLPEGALSWVPYLLKRALRDAQRREASRAVGGGVSVFVDAEGGMLTCGRENRQPACNYPRFILGHDWGADVDPGQPRVIGPPTPVPSMQGRRIASVAASHWHCLALSRTGQVYSWGNGGSGSLGHANGSARAVPSRIESLSRIESIAVGPYLTSAAADDQGRLFTWGRAGSTAEAMPTGLGYKLHPGIHSQLTPKRVDALSGDRVVGVSLGYGFTLAVTDAGAVCSFGYSREGALGHGSFEAEVLPRWIEALAQTGRRFVAVAAGTLHAFALTEEGELYGWGDRSANGHGPNQAHFEPTPRQLTAFVGHPVKHVGAGRRSSCVVTEKGELFTWGDGSFGRLGHNSVMDESTPKRVEGLRAATVTVSAISESHHTLVADADGGVWAFGGGMALGLGTPGAVQPQDYVLQPSPIHTLRVRASESPGVLQFRWYR